MAWMAILKLAGPKLGKVALGLFIDQVAGEDADRIKASLFGEDKGAKLEENFNRLQKNLEEINNNIQLIDLQNLFKSYNDAHVGIDKLWSAYETYATSSSPEGVGYRLNACRAVLGEAGVLSYAREMIVRLLHKNFPRNKSLLEEYSDFLFRSDKNIDVFSYCDKMETLVDHLRITLISALSLREICYMQIKSGNNVNDFVRDILISDSVLSAVNTHLREVIKLAHNVRASFKRAIFNPAKKENISLRLQHCVSKNYLTGHQAGSPSNKEMPFEGNDYAVTTLLVEPDRFPDGGEPQIFVHEEAIGQIKINGQMENYFARFRWGEPTDLAYKLRKGSLATDTQRRLVSSWLVVMESSLQHWRVELNHDGDQTVVILIHAKSGMALAGVKSDCLYLTPFDKSNEAAWWQPVLTRNEQGKADGKIIMLKHWGDHRALDANGGRVYSGNRTVDHNNKWMKWRIEEV
jgi:hypothetical protein